MAVQENQKRKKPVTRAEARPVTRAATSRSQAASSKPRKSKVTKISSGGAAAKVVPLRKEYRKKYRKEYRNVGQSVTSVVSVTTSYNARVLSVVFFLVGVGVFLALGSFIYEEWSANLLGSNLFGRFGHVVASTLFELFGYSSLLVVVFCLAYGNFYWTRNADESAAYNADVKASQQCASARGGKLTLFFRHVIGCFGILSMFAVAVSALWSLSGDLLVRSVDIPGIPVEVVGGAIGFWMYDAFVEPLNVMGILVMSLVMQVLIWNVFFSYSLERQFLLFGSLFSFTLTFGSEILRGVQKIFRSFSVILWNGGRGTTSASIILLSAGISALKWLLRVLGFFPLLFYRALRAVASFVVSLMVPHNRQDGASGEGRKSQTGAVVVPQGAADLVERPRAEIARTVNIVSSQLVSQQRQHGDMSSDKSNAGANAKTNASGGFLGLGKKAQRDDVSQSGASAASGKRTSGNYTLPSLDLLTTGTGKSDGQSKNQTSDQFDRDELIRNCQSLEKALLDFKIGGTIVEVQPGPVITLYQFEPAPGIKVQRIISLADDLALALKVTTVRVYAPVPGKGTVGIEVPNAKREIVRLRDVLASSEMSDSKTRLLLALGKDTFGEPVTADLSKMPHLLIAGATGTGKSVCINSLLLSLLYRNTPRDLRLLLIDPKMLELSVYEGIPHLKCPVITNPKRARGVLWWAVEEMERRYNLMKDLGVRNLASYNKAVANGGALGGEDDEHGASYSADGESGSDEGEIKILGGAARFAGHSHLPRIVIVVDEMADLMLTVGKEIEELLTRLAQKARASGIHLILATQRPSVNVITGLIKANFPTRISFQVASRIDSRTVLDSSGSERLLGMGDMLFMTPGIGRLKRMHSPFVSDAEVQQVASAWTSQGAPDYDREIDEILRRLEESEKGTSGGALFEDEVDSLYDQAVNVVMEKGVASTSLIQRVFRIGYNRAARILEMMEKEGVVGPADGAKPRQVFHNGV